jgi:hypothetical protein
MSDGELSRIEKIFHAARLLPPDERAALLTGCCGEDETLRSEVESLLDCAEQTNNPLKSSVVPAVFRLLFDDEAESLLGRTLGHYQILFQHW